MNFFSWLKSTFSEPLPDGSGSCSRILITAIIFFTLGWGTAIASKIHTNITVADLNSFMGAAGMFITTTVTPLYLINKGSNVINAKTTKE